MQSLEKRIVALETRTGKQEPFTIIRTFLVPGQIKREIERLTDARGSAWHRLPGESEQGLIDRASFQCARNAGGVAWLSATDGIIMRAR